MKAQGGSSTAMASCYAAARSASSCAGRKLPRRARAAWAKLPASVGEPQTRCAATNSRASPPAAAASSRAPAANWLSKPCRLANSSALRTWPRRSSRRQHASCAPNRCSSRCASCLPLGSRPEAAASSKCSASSTESSCGSVNSRGPTACDRPCGGWMQAVMSAAQQLIRNALQH